MIEFFTPTDAPAPGVASRVTRAEELVFVSGTGAGNDIDGAPRAFACIALGPDAVWAPEVRS
jgi:hypothetical protein